MQLNSDFEKVDMPFVNDRANDNAIETVKLYWKRFLNEAPPQREHLKVYTVKSQRQVAFASKGNLRVEHGPQKRQI